MPIIPEVDFPRGGGDKVKKPSKNNSTTVRQHTKSLFQDKFSEDPKRKRKSKASNKSVPLKKRKKGSNDDEDENDSDENKEDADDDISLSISSIELLTRRTLSETMNILGIVLEVQNERVLFSLPGNMVGTLSITDICDAYSNVLKQHLQGNASEELAPLNEMFTIGSQFTCNVKHIESGEGGPKIHLTLNPQEINQYFHVSNLKNGMVLQGAIQSQEDHGYVIDFGISGATGFLKNESAETFITNKNNGQKLPVGKILHCMMELGKSANKMNLHSLNVMADPKRIMKSVISEEMNLNLTNFLPGMQVPVKIVKICENGLIVEVWKYTGLIHKLHLNMLWDKLEDYKIDEQYVARVLYMHPLLKVLQLSLQPELSYAYPKNPFTDLEWGQVFNKAVVVDRSSSGLYLRLGDDYKAFCQKNQLTDKNKPSDQFIRKHFAYGSKHKVQVLGWNAVDNTVAVTMKPSLVDKPVISISNLQPADIVNCTVSEIVPKGVRVKLGPHLRGFIPQIHLIDSVSKSVAKHYKINDELVCRVLKVDKDKQPLSVVLTHKKALIKSFNTPVTSFDSVQKGDLVDGIVVFMSDKQILVGFYNDIRGMVSETELHAGHISNPTALYRIGQVITCRVITVQLLKSLIILSAPIIDSDPLATGTINASNLSMNIPIIPGQLYEGKIIEKFSDGLLLQLENSDVQALLPSHHLSDHFEHYQHLLNTYQVGDIIEDVVGFSKWPKNIVSRKFILVKAAEEHCWPATREELKVGAILPGVVERKTEKGLVIVNLTTGFPGKITEQDAASLNSCPYFHSGLTLMVCIRRIRDDKKLVTLSSRLYHCWDGANSMSLDMMENFLQEKAEILKKMQSCEVFTKDLAFLHIGQLVTFKVGMKSQAGVTGYIGDNVPAIATVNHSKGVACEEGDMVHGLIVNLDVENNVVELTLQQSIVKAQQRTKELKFKEGYETNGIVLDVKENYVLFFLRGQATGTFAYLPLKRHLNDWKDRRKSFKIGSTKKVVIRRITDSGAIVTLQSENYNPQFDLKGVAKKNITLPCPSRGLVCDAVITSMSSFQMDVTLKTQPTITGRIHITEIVDDLEDGVNPLKQYHDDQEITVRILEIVERKCKLEPENTSHFAECSMKPSILNAQNRIRTGRTKPKLKKGSVLLGYISEFADNGLRLHVTPTMQGTVNKLQISKDVKVANKPQKHLCVGAGFHTHVLSTKHNVLQLTMTGLFELTEGSLINCFVTNCDKEMGISVELSDGYRGTIAMTDLSDDYSTSLVRMLAVSKREIVRAYILKVRRSSKEVSLSLRSSRVSPSTSQPIVDPELHEVSVGSTCRGFVEEIEGDNATVALGTYLYGILPLGTEKRLMKGSLISVTVTEIEFHGIMLKLDSICTRVELPVSESVEPPKKKPKVGKKKANKERLLCDNVDETMPNVTSKQTQKIRKMKSKEVTVQCDDDVDEPTPKVKRKKAPKVEKMKLQQKEPLQCENVLEPGLYLSSMQAPKVLTENELNEVPRLEIGESFIWEDPKEEENEDSSDDDDTEGKNKDGKSKKKKQGQRFISDEHELYKMERLLADESRDPQTVDDFDRLILTSPNSSIIWLKYMAYHLQNAEVEKARSVAERALKTICFRDEGEKLNVWVAYLNMENIYGTKESMDAVLQAALQANEPRKIYDHLMKIYIDSEKIEEAEALHEVLRKRFKGESDVWINYVTFLMHHNKAEDARKLLERSFQSLPQKTHIGIISRFAQLEFKFGEAERGRTMFENIVANFPRRTDLWSVYIDLMIKRGDQDAARNLIQRALSSDLPQKRIKAFANKYSHVVGTEEDSSLGQKDNWDSDEDPV